MKTISMTLEEYDLDIAIAKFRGRIQCLCDINDIIKENKLINNEDFYFLGVSELQDRGNDAVKVLQMHEEFFESTRQLIIELKKKEESTCEASSESQPISPFSQEEGSLSAPPS